MGNSLICCTAQREVNASLLCRPGDRRRYLTIGQGVKAGDIREAFQIHGPLCLTVRSGLMAIPDDEEILVFSRRWGYERGDMLLLTAPAFLIDPDEPSVCAFSDTRAAT
jgi:hypothetical protein